MKAFLFLIPILIIALCSSPAAAQKDFVLVKKNDHDKIYIYERWIELPGPTPVKAREVRGDFSANCSVAEAIALLKNEKKIQEWQDHVSEFKVYPGSDSSWWHEYSYHDIPWPVSDQDHFLKYEMEKGSTPEKVVLTFASVVDAKRAPVREDVTRMELRGSWLIEKVSPTQVKLTYKIISRPIGIPRIFTDPVIRSNIMTTIRGYIKVVEAREQASK